MVKRALSDRVKRQKARRADNAILQQAVDAFRHEQTKSGQKKGVRAIAREFGIPGKYKTILNHASGRTVPMSAFNASKQKLLPAEERELVSLLLESAHRGFPFSVKAIEIYADALIKARKGGEYDEERDVVGGSWVGRFLDRHRDELQTHWSRPLDTQRAKSLNPEVVKAWFDLVEEVIVKRGIWREDIYGMDESGFPPSDQGVHRVVGARGTKTQHLAANANRENVTALVTICADGTALVPTIIFKGKNFMKKWAENNVANASFCHSPNGWTDTEIAYEWLVKDFDRLTKDKAGSRTRVLLLDGHGSHFSLELLQYAKENNIEILGYPPHCTHALQGLDVVCFAKMKDIWYNVIRDFEKQNNGRAVGKGDFTELFGRAYLKAFTMDTVKAAFAATGICPFDRNVITSEQMKPSEPTSVKGQFPMPLPSPVRAILATYHSYQPTAFELDADTHRAITPIQAVPLLRSASPCPSDMSYEPCTPTRKRPHAPEVLNFTPSKRSRIMTAALTQTTSGSFLVTTARLTSSQVLPETVLEHPPPLPQPDWALMHLPIRGDEGVLELQARLKAVKDSLRQAKVELEVNREINAAANAQLVLKDMILAKQNQALHAKETRRKSDNTKLFPDGKGRHMTSDAVIAEIERKKERKQQAADDKESRKRDRTAKKAEAAAIENAWVRIKLDHARAVEEWETSCRTLQASGIKKRDLPRKPICPRKPKTSSGVAQGGPTVGSGHCAGEGVEAEQSDSESEDSDCASDF